MTYTQAKLDRIFEYVNKLNVILDEQEYEQFVQQQDLFSDLLKDFLKKHSQEELNSVIEHLKRLQQAVNLLQERSSNESKQLKQKSLALQRNKNKVNAYK